MAFSNLSNQLAINPQALDQLRAQASKSNDTREGVKAAARQFETYFLQMMLRSMRETLPQDGLFDSNETKSFTEMFDQQLSQTVAQGKGVGLTDMLLAQIERSLPKNAGDSAFASPVNYNFPKVGTAAKAESASVTETPVASLTKDAVAPAGSNSFIQQMWPHAVDAAKSLGVPPQSLLAQAALESGWGKRELKNTDGSNTYNLFNIKAGSNWTGPTMTREVSEYKHGNMVKSTEKFRVYGSYDEAFSDYAKLISGNSRYSGVLNQDAQGFAAGLQQGGFATDPGYANKIMRVFNSPAFRDPIPGDALQSLG